MKLNKKIAYQTLNHYDRRGDWLKPKFVVQLLRECVKDDVIHDWFYWGDDLIEIYLNPTVPNKLVYSKRVDRVPSDEIGLYGTNGGFREVKTKVFRFNRRADKVIRKIIGEKMSTTTKLKHCGLRKSDQQV